LDKRALSIISAAVWAATQSVAELNSYQRCYGNTNPTFLWDWRSL